MTVNVTIEIPSILVGSLSNLHLQLLNNQKLFIDTDIKQELLNNIIIALSVQRSRDKELL